MKYFTLQAAFLLLASAFTEAAPQSHHGVLPTRAERHEDGSLSLDFDRRHGNPLSKRGSRIKIFKCTSEQESAISASWGAMLDMSRLVNEEIGKGIDFESEIAKDFFGTRARDDTGFHSGINGVVLSVLQMHPDYHEPQDENEQPLKINMRCDDISWKSYWQGMSKEEIIQDRKCPLFMNVEDADKCESPCWRYSLQHAPQPGNGQQLGYRPRWSHNALAYVNNPVTKPGPNQADATINFCPGWFNRPTCQDAYRSSSSSESRKYDLTNYLCRDADLMHELMHVKAYRERYSDIKEQISDRVFNLKWSSGNIIPTKAYGPFYTRVLARWKDRPAMYTRTNADNLAMFFLSSWIKRMGGFYPNEPEADEKPYNIEPQKRQFWDLLTQLRDRLSTGVRTEDLWDPVGVSDGQVAILDGEDLQEALGVESMEEALEVSLHNEELDMSCDMDLHEDGEEEEEHFESKKCQKPEILELDAALADDDDAEASPLPSPSPSEIPESPIEEEPANPPPEPTNPPPEPTNPSSEPDKLPENCAICNDIMGASMCYFPTQDNDCLRKECAELEECKGCDRYCKVLVGEA